MSQVEFLLTVGKLDASLALLTTDDHHVIEFPTVLLPDDVKAGSIVKLAVSQTFEEERKQRDLFREIQAKILEKYGTKRPSPPVLKVLNVTQTSCVLAWDPLQLGSANLKSLVLYRQGVRSTVIPCPLKTNTTKISGLSVDTDYEFELKLTTTSGQLWSEKVKTHTHKMTDMSGITVCLGPLDPLLGISGAQVAQSLSQIGAKPMQKKVAIDTTHFVTNDVDNDDDPELIKAKNSNIPIVRPEWVRASEMERRIVGVRGFYLDADQGILKSYQFPPASEEAKVAFSKLKAGETTENLNLNDKELPKHKEPVKEAEEDGKPEEAEEDTEKENGDRPRITEQDLKDAVEPSNGELRGEDVVEESEVKSIPREITDSEIREAVTAEVEEVVAGEPKAVTRDAEEVAAVEPEATTKDVEEVAASEPEASKSEEDLAGPEKTEEEITAPEPVAAPAAADVTTATEGVHEVGGITETAETAPEAVEITEAIETVPLAEVNDTVQETVSETDVVSPETTQVAEPLETVPASAETETTATVDAVPTSAETETTAIAEVAPTTAETETTAAEVTESAEAAPSTAEIEAETTEVPELQAVPEVEQEAPEALVEADVDSPVDPASGKVEGQLEKTPEPTATPETVGTDSNESVEENNEENTTPGSTTTKKTTKKNKNKKKNKKKK